MGWAANNRFQTIIIGGGAGGEFVYNATLTQLESSNCGAATHDPVLSIACPQGFATYNSHGKVINLLSTANNAFFQYADVGASQGPLILSVASVAGTDPVDATAYPAGLVGTDAFGNFTLVQGSGIEFSTTAMTRGAGSQVLNASDAAHSPLFKVDGPEQTAASHLSMLLEGGSPDGTTRTPQWLIAAVSGSTIPTPSTDQLAEIQGTLALQNKTAPATTTGFAGAFASTGHLDYVAGVAGDGNTYSTGRKTTFSTTIQTITSTTPATITGMSAPVSIGTYRVHGYVNGLQGGGTFATIVGFTGPATSLVAVMTRNYQIVNGATAEAQQPQVLTGLGSVTTPAFTTPDAFGFEFDGIITFTAAGTFAVTGAQGSATHNWSSQPGSFLDLMPVA